MHTPTFVVALVLGLVQIALASPPACLLAALGQQPNPADLDSLCGKLQDRMTGNLTEVCSGAHLKSAYSVYSATCKAQGSTVDPLTTSSGSKTSGAATATATKSSDGSDSTSSSGSGSGMGAGSTSSNTAASPSATGAGQNGAQGNSPRLLFAVSGLLAAALTSVLFL